MVQCSSQVSELCYPGVNSPQNCAGLDGDPERPRPRQLRRQDQSQAVAGRHDEPLRGAIRQVPDDLLCHRQARQGAVGGREGGDGRRKGSCGRSEALRPLTTYLSGNAEQAGCHSNPHPLYEPAPELVVRC